jgi:hypothetical protein
MDTLNPTNPSVLENDDTSSAIKLMLDGGMPSGSVIRDRNQSTGPLFLNDMT